MFLCSCSNNESEENYKFKSVLDKLNGTWYSVDGDNSNITFGGTIVACKYSSSNECSTYASTKEIDDDIGEEGEFWLIDNRLIFQQKPNISISLEFDFCNGDLILGTMSYSRTPSFVDNTTNFDKEDKKSDVQVSNISDNNNYQELYHTWVSLSNNSSSITFNSDGTYVAIDLNGVISNGVYSYDQRENKLIVAVDSESLDELLFASSGSFLVNNLIISPGNDVYVIKGQEPNLISSSTTKISGFYQDELNGYLYSFSEDGMMKYYGDVVNENIMYMLYGNTLIEIMDGKLCGVMNCTVNNWGSIDIPSYTGHLAALLKPISQTNFENKVASKEYLNYISKEYPELEILADSIKLRILPSTEALAEKGDVQKGEVYKYIEVVENEGYTWYRIEEFGWIADKNEEWIRKLN